MQIRLEDKDSARSALACCDKLRCTCVDRDQAAAEQPQRRSCVGRKRL